MWTSQSVLVRSTSMPTVRQHIIITEEYEHSPACGIKAIADSRYIIEIRILVTPHAEDYCYLIIRSAPVSGTHHPSTLLTTASTSVLDSAQAKQKEHKTNARP